MNLDSIIFIDSFPSLDLHGLDRDYARIRVNEFIEDNYIMGNECFVIVHGFGKGVLLNTTLDALGKNKKVLEFKRFNKNPGCTVVRVQKKAKH